MGVSMVYNDPGTLQLSGPHVRSLIRGLDQKLHKPSRMRCGLLAHSAAALIDDKTTFWLTRYKFIYSIAIFFAVAPLLPAGYDSAQFVVPFPPRLERCDEKE